MASVDKIKIGTTSYDISPSKDGTLNGFTSGDSASPTAWTAVNAITASDSNSTIFNKVTSMVKNIRWLYNKLGTTDFSATGQSTVTGALSALNTSLAGKAASSHSHTTAQLPVSSQQVNDNNHIPTSALVYSMQQQITSLNDAIGDIVINQDPPNNRTYDPNTNLGTWTSISAVDSFLGNFNHANGYKSGNVSLAIGNKITIQDGTYNTTWVIAGFDLEHKQVAADGSVYDNGYGIALIPYELISDSAKAKYHSESDLTGGYISSSIHTTSIPAMVNKLTNVLGNHIVTRNVLLSSSNTGTSSDSFSMPIRISNSYTWTASKATLMSVGQLTGTFGSNRNKFDDGEATYKLPIFDHSRMSYGYNGKDRRPDRTQPNPYWLRNICGAYNSNRLSKTPYTAMVTWEESDEDGETYYHEEIYESYINSSLLIRPLIYIR